MRCRSAHRGTKAAAQQWRHPQRELDCGACTMDTMRSHRVVHVTVLLLGALCAGASQSANDGNPPDARRLVQAQLVAETSTLQRGKSRWLAVHLKTRPGWHTYWRN